ncbi:hypothetical protein BG006_003146 [Podila minutissima]|uniref:CRAL-TRIO domain-containing protein n=1 Tax=Podila minutissima TaxID=64525 RepID=A0A9P5S8K8_9FUNG|nr:hypothetical protein BG006_003146 [Podila minutissima]
MLFKAFKWRLHKDISALKYSSDDKLDSHYLNVRLHKPNAQPAKTLEKLTVYVMETGCVHLEYPVETVCLVFDLTGFSLANMDFNMFKYLATVFEAYYPESLGRIIIHGASFVYFTCSDNELTQCIDANYLPVQYKSSRDKDKYKYIRAQPGENRRLEDTKAKEKLFEALTREWITVGTPEAKPAGTEAEIKVEREQVAKDLCVAFFKINPYIRACNMFHRSTPQVAQDDGSVKWT